ncbi:MAG: hypothetical protein MJB14_00295 [Spirochaetes bacterium]|nr:hypothetical protein [Spirochaetota bacterium]
MNNKKLIEILKIPGLTVLIFTGLIIYQILNESFVNQSIITIIAMVFFYLVLAFTISYFVIRRINKRKKNEK